MRSVLGLLVSLSVCWALAWWQADPWPVRVELRGSQDDAALGFSPDGRFFLTSNVAKIKCWDCTTGKLRTTWSIPAGVAVTGDFAPDGRTYAAAIRNNGMPAQLVLIDVASGKIKATATTRFSRPAYLHYDDDGTVIRLPVEDHNGLREVVLFDPATGAELSVMPIEPGPSGRVNLGDDGKMLVHGMSQRGLIEVEVMEPNPRFPRTALGGASSVGASGGLGCSLDGQTLALGRIDGSIDFYDRTTGQRLRSSRPHGELYAAARLIFAADGQTLFSWGLLMNGPQGFWPSFRQEFRRIVHGKTPVELVVLDLASGRILVRSAAVNYLYYAPDGRTVATRDEDQVIRIRSLPKR